MLGVNNMQEENKALIDKVSPDPAETQKVDTSDSPLLNAEHAQNDSKTKKCPFCNGLIPVDAIKCKHCGEFLDASTSQHIAEEECPWYFRKIFIIVALLSVGPLALPLIWLRPQTSLAWKIGLTVAILVLSWILLQTTVESIRVIKEYYKLIEEL